MVALKFLVQIELQRKISAPAIKSSRNPINSQAKPDHEILLDSGFREQSFAAKDEGITFYCFP